MKTTLFGLALLLCLQLKGQNLDTGIRLYQNKNLDQAYQTFEAIKSSDPAYAKAQYYLGRISFDRENFEDARGFFKEATKADNTNADYYTWLGHAVGTVTQSAGKLRQASLAPKIKNAYLKAVEIDPTNLDAQWGLFQFYSQAPGFVGGSWEKAELTARAIGEIDKLRGHDALVTVYESQEEPELAEKEYLAMVKLDPRYMGRMGVFYQNQGWYDKAFDTFQEAFAKYPENWSLLYQIGRTSALSGQQSELGIQSLERYLKDTDVEKAAPSHAAAKMRLAMIYEKQGEVTKARQLYEESLNEDPELELAKKGLKRVK